ncbi:MAG: hypothetical protein QG670_1919, partial [Thermoproteota archaeon]|nr:hypothetical protein [Thermoproteota archaeon]
PTDSLP